MKDDSISINIISSIEKGNVDKARNERWNGEVRALNLEIKIAILSCFMKHKWNRFH